jgi:hypothetical protein
LVLGNLAANDWRKIEDLPPLSYPSGLDALERAAIVATGQGPVLATQWSTTWAGTCLRVLPLCPGWPLGLRFEGVRGVAATEDLR